MGNKDGYKDLYVKYGEIKIRCEAKDGLPLDAIMDLQGSLKKRSKKNKLKLAERMFKLGFIAPFFVWDNKGDYMNLDGNARSQVLCEIREAGIPIPGIFPAAYIQAKDETEAKEIILSISSQYGEIDETELSEWLDNMGGDIRESLRLLDGEIDLGISEENIETRAPDSSEKERCLECGQTIKNNNE